MLAEVAEDEVARFVLFVQHERTRRVRQEDLAAIRDRADARGGMDGESR